MFDTHTHIQFKIFENAIDDVVDTARKAEVKNIIAVGTDLNSSKKAVELSKQFSGIFASVGIHPHHVFEHFHSQEKIQEHLDGIEELLGEINVVAVGEAGMDRHEYQKTKYPGYRISDEFIALQKYMFEYQIKLAKKYHKSLIIHNRGAVLETLTALKDNWSENFNGRGVFHCCEPSEQVLEFAKEFNIYIGVDGDVTYDRAKQNFVKIIPLENLVLETDSPYFVPKDLGFPNTPANLEIIAQKIAQIKRADVNIIKSVSFENSKKLFGV